MGISGAVPLCEPSVSTPCPELLPVLGPLGREREIGPAVSSGRHSVLQGMGMKKLWGSEVSLLLSPIPARTAWPLSPALLIANRGHVVVGRG